MDKSTKFLYPSESDIRSLGTQLLAHFKNHRTFETDLNMVKNDATPIIVEITIAKIMSDRQWQGKVVTTIRDVTELRQTQQAL